MGFSLIGFSLGPQWYGPLWVLSDRVFFRVVYSGSAGIDSSLGSSRLFLIFFYQIVICFMLFYLVFCFTFITFSKTISLTRFNNFNKTDSEEINEEILIWWRHKILYWKYMSSNSGWIYSTEAATAGSL